MRRSRLFLMLALCFCTAALTGAERIAVAEIRCQGEVQQKDFSGFAGYIESQLSGTFEVVSRDSLPAMLKEWEFTQSGLVLPESRRTELAQKSVDKLLVCTVSKAGTRFALTLRLADPATGMLDTRRSASMTARTPEELYNRLPGLLSEIGLREKGTRNALKKIALLPAEPLGVVLPQGVSSRMVGCIGEYLLKSGSFELLSREDLAHVAGETALAATALADPMEMARLGKVKIGDYVVVTRIIRFRHRVQNSTTAIAGTASARHLVDVSLQLRIIDVSTGKYVAMENLEQHLDSRSIPAEIRRDWTPDNYAAEAVTRLARRAGERLLDTLDPLLVAGVSGQNVYLSRGEGAGVYPGSVYEVFTAGNPLRHPRTGVIIGRSEERIGTIRVVSVRPGMATAVMVSGKIPSGGAVCRKPDASSAVLKNAPAFPKAE